MPDQQPPDWAPEPPPDWPPPAPDGFDAPAAGSAPSPPAPTDTPLPRRATSPRGPEHDRPQERPVESPVGSLTGPYVPPPPPGAASRRRRRHGCLIAILALTGVLVLGVGGCFLTCGDLFEDSYKIGVWGWQDGEGPDLAPGSTTQFGTAPQPQDSAAPDPVKDAEAQEGLVAIRRGLLAFEKAEDRSYDSSRDGSWELALQPYVDPWPANPWTGEPMHEGVHRGDVQFPGWSDEFDLTVYISP